MLATSTGRPPLGGVDRRRRQGRGSNGRATAAPEVAGAAQHDGLERRHGRGKGAAERERGSVVHGVFIEGDFGDGHDATSNAQRRRDGAKTRGAADERGELCLTMLSDIRMVPHLPAPGPAADRTVAFSPARISCTT